MSTEYLKKLEEIQKLINKMDLPAYRKTVKHNDDLRWLKKNLSLKNEKHKNYKEVILLISNMV